jgi:hypothetical protein
MAALLGREHSRTWQRLTIERVAAMKSRHQVCSLRQRFAVGEVVAAFFKRPESVRHPVTNHRLPRSRWVVLAGSDEASRPEIGLQSLNYWSF